MARIYRPWGTAQLQAALFYARENRRAKLAQVEGGPQLLFDFSTIEPFFEDQDMIDPIEGLDEERFQSIASDYVVDGKLLPFGNTNYPWWSTDAGMPRFFRGLSTPFQGELLNPITLQNYSVYLVFAKFVSSQSALLPMLNLGPTVFSDWLNGNSGHVSMATPTFVSGRLEWFHRYTDSDSQFVRLPYTADQFEAVLFEVHVDGSTCTPVVNGSVLTSEIKNDWVNNEIVGETMIIGGVRTNGSGGAAGMESHIGHFQIGTLESETTQEKTRTALASTWGITLS